MRQILESMMLILFGISWPVNVLKSWRTRSAKGKSLLFLCLIFAGYIAGTCMKLLYSRDYVMVFYLFNMTFVGADILLYFRNRRLDRDRERTAAGRGR
ncbi:MAG: hypothetical protein QM296_10995 [Bacillota bacterium]|nr:hypothetical protein [Bacillota bacterium]